MNYIYIGNRQSYKSTMGMHKFMEDPKNSLLIVHNSSTKKMFKKIINDTYVLSDDEKIWIENNIQTPNVNAGIGMELNCIIFDEFFYFNEHIASIAFTALVPCLTARQGKMFIYSSLVHKSATDRIRQEKLVELLENDNNWKVIRLNNGLPEPIEYIKPWAIGYEPQVKFEDPYSYNEIRRIY